MAELVIKLVNGELAGKTAQTLAKEINEAGRAARKAEVGTQAWVDAHQKLDKAKALQQDLRKQVESTTAASDKLKSAWNALPGAQYFNQVGESFGLLKGGVGGLVTEFGVLKTAIAATGIGLLVVVLGSLYTWFTKTEEGADKLKSVMYPLQVLFQKVTGIVAELGGKVFKQFGQALTDPVQAIKDLGRAIYDNIINRFEALGKFGPAIAKLFSGDIVGGFKDLGNATIQLTIGIENGIDKIVDMGKEVGEIWDDAYNKGQQLLDQENAIEDAEVELVKTRARLNVEFKRLADIAKDVSKSDKERLDAAHAAADVQDRLAAAEENYLRLKLQRLKLEQNLDGILTDDERLERAQLEADLIQLQADNIQRKQEVASVAHTIEKKQQTEREAARKQELKAVQALEDMKLEAMVDSREKDIAALELHLSRQIEALDKNAPLYAETVAATQDLAMAKRAEINMKWDEQERKRREEEAQSSVDSIQDTLDAQNLILLQKLTDREISREEFDISAEENQLVAWENQLIALEEQGMKETDLYKQILDQKLQLEVANQEKIKAARSATFDAVVGLANAQIDSQIAGIERENAAMDERLEHIKATQGEESAAYRKAQKEIDAERKRNAERIKKMETTKVRINLFSEIANIWMNANSFPPPFNAILGAILTASAIVRANQNIQAIQSQKYEQGGLLTGPRHSQGGIPIEAEGGEFIFSRKAVRGIGVDNLNRVNNFYTKRFAAGGPVDPFDSSGSTSSPSSNSPAPALVNERPAWVDEMIAAQDRRIDRIKVVNVLTDTEEGLRVMNNIRDDADV